MTGLDLFALFVLLILFATTIDAWVILGMLPGRIALSRHHPQAEAINICGWFGAISMGILSPVAYIWAYTKPIASPNIPLPDSEISKPNEAKK